MLRQKSFLNDRIYSLTPAEARAFYEEHVLGAAHRFRDQVAQSFKPFTARLTMVGSVLLQLYHGPDPLDARMGFNLVVNAGKDFVVDRLQSTSGSPALMDYVAVGTGNTAAAAGDTALQTEIGTRVQGTLSQPASTTDRVVSTFAAGNATGALTETGRLNAAAAGTLLGRIVFSVVNKGANDSLQVTYDLTVS
jgi:hypothetical protein